MTSERFCEIMDLLGWNKTEAARRLEMDPRRVRRMANGLEPIYEDTAAWMEVQAANPPPQRTRRAGAQ